MHALGNEHLERDVGQHFIGFTRLDKHISTVDAAYTELGYTELWI